MPKKLKILLLGSYYPPRKDLGDCRAKAAKKVMWKSKLGFFRLKPMERLIYLREKLRRKHIILLGDSAHKSRKMLFHRVYGLMEKADLIFVLLKNQGGVVVEHTMCLDKKFSRKSLTLVDQKDEKKLSGLIRYGTLDCLPHESYKTEKELFGIIIRKISAHQFSKIIPNSIDIDLTAINSLK